MKKCLPFFRSSVSQKRINLRGLGTASPLFRLQTDLQSRSWSGYMPLPSPLQASSIFSNFFHWQVHDLFDRIISREDAFTLCEFSYHPMIWFYCVGGVDQIADFSRIIKNVVISAQFPSQERRMDGYFLFHFSRNSSRAYSASSRLTAP